MKKIVLFDIDNVLIEGQTQKLLIHFLLKKRRIKLLFFLKLYFWFLFYRLGLIKDTIKIREKAFKSLTGWDEVEAKQLFKYFFEEYIKPRIFNESIDMIRTHINHGYEVILVSASLSEIVDEFKKYLSLKFAISTKLEIVNGVYTGKILGNIPYGENKVKAAKIFLEDKDFALEESYAYADHFSDLPLLEMVRNPVVVNPDSKLRKIATKRKWTIYDFKRR